MLAVVFAFSSHVLFAQGNSGNGGNGNGNKPPIGSLGPVNLPYWKLIGNSVDSGAFAGTTNNFPFKIKVNNVLQASFTNSGLDLEGNLHSSFATVDSILTAWTVLVNDALNAKTINAERYFQNDTLVDLIGLMNSVGSLQSATGNLSSLQTDQQFEIDSIHTAISGISDSVSAFTSQVSNLTSQTSDLTSQTSDLISQTSNLTSQVSDLTSQVSNLIGSVDTVVLNTVQVNEIITQSISSDTIYLSGPIMADTVQIPNELKLGDHSLYISGIKTGDPNSSNRIYSRDGDLMVQSIAGNNQNTIIGYGNSGNVGIGTLTPDEKLTVNGNISVSGNISAKDLNVSSLNASGQTNIDSLNVLNELKIGTNSVHITSINTSLGPDNNIYSDNGKLLLQSKSGNNFNTIINANNIGNIGMGTLIPGAKLDVRIPIAPNQIAAMIKNDNDGFFFVPSLGNEGYNKHSVEGDAGIFWNGYQGANQNAGLVIGPWESGYWSGLRITHQGKIGIGTINPSALLTIVGKGSSETTSSLNILKSDNTSSIFFVRDDGKLGIGTTNPKTALHIYKNEGALNLEGSTHVFMQFYPIGFNNGRKAWLGFGSSLAPKTFSIQNEEPDGIIQLISPTININGNVGVGTSNPKAKLNLISNGSITPEDLTQGLSKAGILISSSYAGATNNNYLPGLFWSNTNTGMSSVNLPKAGIWVKQNGGTDLYLGTSSNYEMGINSTVVIDQKGQVGIGTEENEVLNAKMQIRVSDNSEVAFAIYNSTSGLEEFRIMGDGKFYGRGYKIKLGPLFPDYVFGKEYKRMASDQKAKYIDEFGHMPYLPSAKEIEKEGLDVGDGLIGITRNVEENSLDINDLFKQNAELIKRIEKLEREIKMMKNKTGF